MSDALTLWDAEQEAGAFDAFPQEIHCLVQVVARRALKVFSIFEILFWQWLLLHLMYRPTTYPLPTYRPTIVTLYSILLSALLQTWASIPLHYRINFFRSTTYLLPTFYLPTPYLLPTKIYWVIKWHLVKVLSSFLVFKGHLAGGKKLSWHFFVIFTKQKITYLPSLWIKLVKI